MSIEVGKVVQGKVTGIQSYGVFVRLSDGCAGLIHISNMPNDTHRKREELFKIGWIVSVEILALNVEKSQANLRLHKPSGKSPFKANRTPKQPLGDEYNNGFAPLAREMPNWIKKALNTRRRKR